MLERAMLVGMRYDLRRDDDLELAFDTVSGAAARGCGFADDGLSVGARADLVLLDAETVAHALTARPVRKRVISHGRIVARNGEGVAR